MLIVVQFAFDPLSGAVKEVDGRPEEIVEVGFEARVLQRRDQGVEDVGDGAGDAVAFGEWPGIGFVLEGTVAVELKLLQNVVGRGRDVVRLEVVMLAHGRLRRLDRDHRGLLATKAHGRRGPAPGAKREGRSAAEDGEGRLFCLAMERQAPPAAGK